MYRGGLEEKEGLPSGCKVKLIKKITTTPNMGSQKNTADFGYYLSKFYFDTGKSIIDMCLCSFV